MDQEEMKAISVALEQLGARRFMMDGAPTPYGQVTCTPEKATELLALSPERQRTVDRNHVRRIADAHSAGHYVFTGDPVRFTSELEMVDGQHRLSAIVKSGVTVELVVCIVPPDAFFVIDANTKPRTMMQLAKLALDKEIQASVIAALILEQEDFRGTKSPLSKDERLRLVQEHRFLENACELHACGPKRPTSGPLSGAIRCMRFDEANAMEFFTHVFRNEHIFSGVQSSAAQALATWIFTRTRGDLDAANSIEATREEAAKAIRAYNAHVAGAEVKLLKGTIDGVMPEVRKPAPIRAIG